ncbi:ethanolamine utilization protein EutJ [Oceanobacillus zhaokaii]|uniref:Ethanolamine utilization protein EutJ n=1 Tax=Oceanobacillus zhaokaii TaxID=2052660 RepID=A0A345PJN5_9BACI|nr:ABC transporter substrate-binding protein [Oceanobacillus zhaokaii]AXI10215.1 ethanolamine utilization protein EutJ [Oceanobacillus zhaokaii]
MKKMQYLSFLGVLMLLTIGLIACVDVSSSNSIEEEVNSKEETHAVTPKVNQGEEIVKIGYSGPLSGAAAQYGANVINGLKMALDEINEVGFIVNDTTYKLELVALDDKYLPNETGINVKRIVSEDSPIAVWIPHSGGVFATQVFNEQDDFIIMAQTSEPRMYEQGNKLMIGVSPQYNIWPETYSKYMLEHFGTKMALLPTNSQYGMDWLNVIKPIWEDMGGEIVYESAIDFAKETDYFTTMSNALNENPDVLFVGGPSEPTALVIKQAKEFGFDGGFMIMDQAKMEEMSGFLGGYEMLEGSIGALPIDQINSQSSSNFVETYKRLFDEQFATADSSLSYQSLYVLVEAMKVAGTVTDREAIMEAVNEGIQNIPENKIVIPLKEMDEVGSLQWKFDAGAVEDGEVISIPFKIE